MGDVRSSQGLSTAAFTQIADLRLTQSTALAAYNIPTQSMQSSQSEVSVTFRQTADISISQGVVLVAAKGRTSNPFVRAWTYTLDGHDFYVLRLGDAETLVYDRYSKKWSTYDSAGYATWRVTVGCNWLGSDAFAASFGSNVLIGDDLYGLLWILNPSQGYDEAPLEGDDLVRFERVAMGQLPVRGYVTIPCDNVYLTANVGEPLQDGDAVELLTSDDSGHNFQSQGSIALIAGNYRQELPWQSLGLMSAPGRLFKIVDNGAVARIDGLELANDSATE